MLSKDQLKKLSNHYKIDIFSIQREYSQIIFLHGLYQQISSKDIIFKGGTAIRLLYHSQRFSEDLDFTTKLSKNNLILDLNKALRYFKNFYNDATYKKTHGKEFDNSYTLILKYSIPELTYPSSLHLDFSLRENTIQNPKQEIINLFVYPLEISRPYIQTMTKEEIIAEKIQAFFGRNKLRDLYDLAFLLQQDKASMELINNKLAYYSEVFSKERFLNKLKNISLIDFKNDLYPFLPINERNDQTYHNSIEIVKQYINEI